MQKSIVPGNAGLTTDILLHEQTGTVERVGDYIVVRTPDSPDYFFGNLLVLHQRPVLSQLEQLEHDFAQWVGVPPAIAHRTFCWGEDSEEAVDLDGFVERGYDATMYRVRVARPDETRAFKANHSVAVRKFRGDRDWEIWTRMQLDDMPDPSDAVSIRYFAYQQRAYRDLVERGLGDWWGAFIGDEQVGSLGLFFLGRTGRFQSVITSEPYRNKGVCKTLVSEVIRLATKQVDRADRLVIVADETYHAGAIYEALGFRPQGRVGSLCKAPG